LPQHKTQDGLTANIKHLHEKVAGIDRVVRDADAKADVINQTRSIGYD
jgi:hypothetical protein